MFPAETEQLGAKKRYSESERAADRSEIINEASSSFERFKEGRVKERSWRNEIPAEGFPLSAIVSWGTVDTCQRRASKSERQFNPARRRRGRTINLRRRDQVPTKATQVQKASRSIEFEKFCNVILTRAQIQLGSRGEPTEE